jgi:drug/metabolite transporter (DMT)-like permease
MAAERTALGWQRASLGLATIAGLLLVHAVHRDEPLGVVAAALAALCAAWSGVEGRRLYVRRTAAPEDATPAVRSLTMLACLTVGSAALCAAELVGSS